MGNNSSSKMVGVGMVCLQIFARMVQMLEDVRHVSDLKKNLFFLSKLDRKATNSPDKVELLKFPKVQWLS